MGNRRIFVEKLPGFQAEASRLLRDLNDHLHLGLTGVRVVNVYDLFNVSSAEAEAAATEVLSEPATDAVLPGLALDNTDYLAVEYLPGQFDQRADSAMQCLSLVTGESGAVITSGKVYMFDAPEPLSAIQRDAVEHYLVNPIEARVKDLRTLALEHHSPPAPVPVVVGFTDMDEQLLADFRAANGMAMSQADIAMIQAYFRDTENRDPTETELKVLDIYWSDHCRHTTFETGLIDIDVLPGRFYRAITEAYQQYLALRAETGRDQRPVTLMDMATIVARAQRARGELADLDVSDEINACSIKVPVDVDGVEEQWLLMFKNETHNHPTEIEPFGGAATCIGGAIRDPLSGRAFVYQAMRVSGVADINEPIPATLPGKLPQRVIALGAAHGNSSYGNQIGLPTTHVREFYHPGYQAKHLEAGAVVGAVRAVDVVRAAPTAGDVVLLLGGGTGRDGIGGATGSSKAHTAASVTDAAAEVQKGNAPMERRIQRLFRDPHATRLIKKCNDFGAGGVCVAIGELAPGVRIDLNAVTVKYQGLNGTELAISESQERMAVVVSANDVAMFQNLADLENVTATPVAEITDDDRLTMVWNDDEIVNISREFLDTNGAQQEARALIASDIAGNPFCASTATTDNAERLRLTLAAPASASRQGMAEMFDGTIGAGTVLMPYGGAHQLTEAEGSVHKLPAPGGETDAASILTCGFDPEISTWSPFHGAVYAVVESVARAVAMGGDHRRIRFSFQEYFPRLGSDPARWGLPVSALLGALHAQLGFGLAAIGGKDSMSGTFGELDVPPTLISFAALPAKASQIVGAELKSSNSQIHLISPEFDEQLLSNLTHLKRAYEQVHTEIVAGNVISAASVKAGGVAETLAKMTFGNKIGVAIYDDVDLFSRAPGALVVETKGPLAIDGSQLIGHTNSTDVISLGGSALSIDDAISAWQGTYAEIYPTATATPITAPGGLNISYTVNSGRRRSRTTAPTAQPLVYLPVFPGTNCEYDSAAAFRRYGAETQIEVFRNGSPSQINDSLTRMAAHIDRAQILMLAGGFSAADEPDGAGKYITAVLRNETIRASVEKLLERDGLILGICNGFQALVKSGLLPSGHFGPVTRESPTLTQNAIGRHVSRIIRTRVASNMSPWLAGAGVGEVWLAPISSGEGQFRARPAVVDELVAKGQVATQYADLLGNATMASPDNPNGSVMAIEGITSPDGRIFGKMAHTERAGTNLLKNVPGDYSMRIFESGVKYFTA